MPLVLDAVGAVERARSLLAATDGRVVIGLAGAPGAGKTHLSAVLADALPGTAVVGMDAFHLAHSVLAARGDVERKGAVDTFDADGYVALLRRIRAGEDRTIWAPEFRREVEDAVAGAVAVQPSTRLVVTEGNYLLLDADPWREVPRLCDEVWFVDPPEALRVERLVARHVRFGREDGDARGRVLTGTDGDNARLVRATRDRADALVVDG